MICDISKYQGRVDWNKLAPQLDFCVLRASVGNSLDERYRDNAAGCDAHGVPYHAYHYIKAATAADARAEARTMATAVWGTSPRFLVIDAEYDGIPASKARGVCEAFEDELRRVIPNDIRVALYIGHHLYRDWALDYGRYAYIWIPRYGVNDGTEAGSARPDWPCDLWQYTSNGRLAGIDGRVDLNALTGAKPMNFFTGGEGDEAADPAAGGADRAAGDAEPVSAERSDETEGRKMLTGKQLADYCEQVFRAGWVYWYGTYGKRCGQGLYESKKKQYPGHYTADRATGYLRDIASGRRCADCVGMIKSFFWTGGQFDAEPKYAVNGCPDVSANGMIKLCAKTGPIATVPDIPGIVVWKEGHIGVYVGGGYTVEMKGFAYDCQRNPVKKGPWAKWGMLPSTMIAYGDAPRDATAPTPTGLRRGDYGSAVKAMQANLLAWDAKCLPKYGADGDFGAETEKAVKAFQASAGLPVTGVCDEATRRALSGDPPAETPPEPAQAVVRVTGGSVYVRAAPNTNGRKLGVAHKGDVLPYQGQDDAGWHLVEYANANGWISGRYSEVVK